MSKADERHDITVEQYVQQLDEPVKSDTLALMDIMKRTSNETPILYGIGTIGYGVYKYQYDSGRKGEAHTLAFYPRKGKITVYLMDGTARYAKLLAKMGKHTTTGFCVYIKRLEDVDVNVLEQILQLSYTNIQEMSQNGPIDHILWQDTI